MTRPAYFIWLGILVSLGQTPVFSGESCGDGRPAITLSTESKVRNWSSSALVDSLRPRLALALGRVGYCLAASETPQDSFSDSSWVLHVLVEPKTPSAGHFETGSGASPGPAGEFKVAFFRAGEDRQGRLEESLRRQLVSLEFSAGEGPSLSDILIKKIEENLREQYMAHVVLETDPREAKVQASGGLEGKSPVEWIVPLGTLVITAEAENYFPMRKILTLTYPGTHVHHLELKKRRFYHSKFIYPALGLAAASLGAYMLERVYFEDYLNLGESDLRNRPEVFEETFKKAQTLERLKVLSLIGAGGFFGLSFRF